MKKKKQKQIENTNSSRNRDIEDPLWIRQTLIKWSSGIGFILSIIVLISGIILPSTFLIAAIFILLIAGSSFFFSKVGKFDLAGSILISGGVIINIFQLYYQQSAYAGCLIVVWLVLAAIMKEKFFITIIVVFYSFFVGIFVAIGRLTWFQTIDQETGVPFVNNITVLVPLVVFSISLR